MPDPPHDPTISSFLGVNFNKETFINKKLGSLCYLLIFILNDNSKIDRSVSRGFFVAVLLFKIRKYQIIFKLSTTFCCTLPQLHVSKVNFILTLIFMS